MKNPTELWNDLKQMVSDAEKDATKATRGMKAGGVRLRATMQDLRDLAMDLRKSVLDHRTSRAKKDGEPIVVLDESAIVGDAEEADLTAVPAGGGSGHDSVIDADHPRSARMVEAVPANKPESPAPAEEDSRSVPYWYSSFSY